MVGNQMSTRKTNPRSDRATIKIMWLCKSESPPSKLFAINDNNVPPGELLVPLWPPFLLTTTTHQSYVFVYVAGSMADASGSWDPDLNFPFQQCVVQTSPYCTRNVRMYCHCRAANWVDSSPSFPLSMSLFATGETWCPRASQTDRCSPKRADLAQLPLNSIMKFRRSLLAWQQKLHFGLRIIDDVSTAIHLILNTLDDRLPIVYSAMPMSAI